MANDEKTFEEMLEQFEIELSREQIDLLSQYCRLLWDWNKKLNLTRHTDFEKFVARDLVDTLELSKLIAANEEVLDVGSGGGVPGIVLAVLRPDLQVTLCESVGKKCQALDAILQELGLPITLFNARAESLLDEFSDGEIALRAADATGTESAADIAPDLSAETDSSALSDRATGAPVVGGDHHRFGSRAVGPLEEELRGAVGSGEEDVVPVGLSVGLQIGIAREVDEDREVILV